MDGADHLFRAPLQRVGLRRAGTAPPARAELVPSFACENPFEDDDTLTRTLSHAHDTHTGRRAHGRPALVHPHMVVSALTAALATGTSAGGGGAAPAVAVGVAAAASAGAGSVGSSRRGRGPTTAAIAATVIGSAPVSGSVACSMRGKAGGGRGHNFAISCSAASTTVCHVTTYAACTPPRTTTRPPTLAGTRFAPSHAVRRTRRGRSGVGEDGGDEEPPADGGSYGEWGGSGGGPGGSGGGGGFNRPDWGDFSGDDGWYDDETTGEARGQAATALLSALALGGGTVGAASAALGGGREDAPAEDAIPPAWVRALYGGRGGGVQPAPPGVAAVVGGAVAAAPAPLAVAVGAGQ